MGISFVASATAGGNVTTLNIAYPSLLVADAAILIWSSSSGNTITDPSGWVAQGTATSAQGGLRTKIYSKVLVGTETGNVGLVMNGTNRQTADMLIYRGCDQTTPVNALTSHNEGSTAVTSHVCPAVTPTVAGCSIVTLIGERQSTGTTSWTVPSGYTGRADSGSAGSGSAGTSTAVADDGLSAVNASGTPVTPPNWVSIVSSSGVTTWSMALAAAISVALPARPVVVLSRQALVRAASY